MSSIACSKPLFMSAVSAWNISERFLISSLCSKHLFSWASMTLVIASPTARACISFTTFLWSSCSSLSRLHSCSSNSAQFFNWNCASDVVSLSIFSSISCVSLQTFRIPFSLKSQCWWCSGFSHSMAAKYSLADNTTKSWYFSFSEKCISRVRKSTRCFSFSFSLLLAASSISRTSLSDLALSSSSSSS